MYDDNKIMVRCPKRGKIFSFIIAIVIFTNMLPCKIKATKAETIPDIVIETIIEESVEEEPINESEIAEEILEESIEEPEEVLEEIPEETIEPEIMEKKVNTEPSMYQRTGKGLTKRRGVYFNRETGLKETWYSQRVLPGNLLDIPGRHVNSEGFVCDEDNYICVASSTYPMGTVIETSRGTGKVYDCGCSIGILDIYVDW